VIDPGNDETCDPPGFPAGNGIFAFTIEIAIKVDGPICRDDCTYCGDGVFDSAYEECDPGAEVGEDGYDAHCNDQCTVDPYCGDGNLDAGEECDDGNNVDGDGCSAKCTIDPYCGDGTVDAGEECDDGNNVDGDGCSAECTTEITPVITVVEEFIIPVTGRIDLLTAGIGHTCALTAKEGLECWGLNEDGQVGDGTFVDKLEPIDVVGIDPNAVIALVSGIKHTCVLTSANEVYCWGLNSSGQLGDGTTENSNVPVYVDGLEGYIVDISAGAEFTCALNSANDVFCWGNNSSGQLNDGTEDNSSVPVKTTTVSDGVLMISGGSVELQGITFDGVVQLWNSQPIIPVTGLPDEDNLFVSADRFTGGGCSMSNVGDVNCWGGITNAEVIGASISDMLASGEGHACTMKPEGLVCWGSNSHGQLGDDTLDDSDDETLVVGLEKYVIVLAAGEKHTCVIFSDETVACWGKNEFGQLGNGTLDDSKIPLETN